MKHCEHYVWNSWTQMEDLEKLGFGYFTYGENWEVRNRNNAKYLDGISSMFHCNIGYQNEWVSQGVSEQLKKLAVGTNHWCVMEPAYKLAKKLCSLTGYHFRHVYFTNSGSEATETAIKLVRQYFHNIGSNKKIILSLEGCYHGASYGAMSLNEDNKTSIFGEMLNFFEKVPTYINHSNTNSREKNSVVKKLLQELEDKILRLGPDQIAALFYEPIQLSNACNVLPIEYIKGLFELSRKYKFLIIADEVATGFGRCGEMFQSKAMGLYPDIMLLAKGITSGYTALGAVMVTEHIYRAFLAEGIESRSKCFAHGFTTSGNPLACRIALEVIRVIEENQLVCHAKLIGQSLLQDILNLQKKYSFIKYVQGQGLMLSIGLDSSSFSKKGIYEPAFFVHQLLKRKGLIIFVETDVIDSLTLAPPLIIKQSDKDKIIKILDEVFAIVTVIQEVK